MLLTYEGSLFPTNLFLTDLSLSLSLSISPAAVHAHTHLLSFYFSLFHLFPFHPSFICLFLFCSRSLSVFYSVVQPPVFSLGFSSLSTCVQQGGETANTVHSPLYSVPCIIHAVPVLLGTTLCTVYLSIQSSHCSGGSKQIVSSQ